MRGDLLVLGAGSGIGQGLLAHACNQGLNAAGVSRQGRPNTLGSQINWLQLGYQHDQHVKPNQVQAQLTASLLPFCVAEAPEFIVICHGLLQQSTVRAEKSIRQFDAAAAEQSWWVNYLLPMLHLQAIWPYLLQRPTKVFVLSAKVGSITDNQLGGWYSYRAAKAALNMAVKTASIELARTQRDSVLATIHPGTTATALSAPFLANLPAGQLQSPQATAARLWQVMQQASSAQSGVLFNWDGTVLPY